MYSLPKTVKIRDDVFKIRQDGDFRMVLDCFNALDDVELSQQERIISCLIIFYEDLQSINDLTKLPDIQEAVTQMFWFFNCGQDKVGMQTDYKLIDWEDDANIICSAINNVARTEIRALPYLHWWTFMGYYIAVGESVLSTIVSIRHKMVKGKKLEKYEQEFRHDNPQYFVWDRKTADAKDVDNYALDIWNKS